MKNLALISSILFTMFCTGCQQSKAESQAVKTNDANVVQQTDAVNETTKIQVAILLDTSNSMDGLIDQAKSRLWNIVNTLTTLKYQGKTPRIEIALYEYGNDELSERSGYVRQVTPLTTDLDLISEKLFSLNTDGGSEYCGTVIRDAVRSLGWNDGKADMKLIYIAGNEPFSQGNVSYKEAISSALYKNIYVNTIFCGDYQTGIEGLWKDGAMKGKGKYFNIDSDAKVQYVSTPYDDAIYRCNEKLNATYISYGSTGRMKRENQRIQDANANKISSANQAERTISKSKSVYNNESWDLVDKMKSDDKALSKMEKEELPKELQQKSESELKELIQQKTKEREAIQKEIASLAKQRQEYIDKQSKANNQDDLGAAINSSILAFAKEKGYESN